LRRKKSGGYETSGDFRAGSDVEASMSAVDGGGDAWSGSPNRNRTTACKLFKRCCTTAKDCSRFGGMHVRRKELRKMADEIKQQHGISMISIPWEFADQIVYEGYERAKARGQSGLENFTRFVRSSQRANLKSKTILFTGD